jgi:DNA polymerase/3'-5' exonuclease PolX
MSNENNISLLKSKTKEQLRDCIKNTSADLGLTMGEFKVYSENRLSTDKSKYISVYPESPDITLSGGKTYVTNLEVLLARNLYTGKKMIKMNDKLSIQLGIPDPPIDWYISEKYDGIRAIWDGEKFISRGQKVFTYVPDFFKELMPPGIALDGEIWISRNSYKEVSSISSLKIGSSKNQKQIDEIWRGIVKGSKSDRFVKYIVYDLPASNQPFETRMKLLEQIVQDRTKVWYSILEETQECPIRFTKQTKIESIEQLANTYKTLTSKGAEGIMLRAPNSPYERKRSKYLLKDKIKDDSEAIVKGYTMGTGKYTGLLGSLDCELIIDNKPSGIKFNIGTGLTDKDRTEYNDPKSSSYIPLESIVSFSYMELSEDSVPRHPVYRGIRDDFVIKTENENQNEGTSSLIIEPKDFKQTIIDSFKILIKNEETKKEPKWQFKIKPYRQIVDLISASQETIDSVKKALEVLRAGGAKYEGEEGSFIKTGEYKSKSIQKIHEIIKTGALSEALEISENPKVKAITELTKVPEIGPAAAEKLYNKGITTIAQLTDAFEHDSKILNNKQAIGVKYFNDLQQRIPREEMDSWNKFFEVRLKLTIENMKIKPSGIKMQLVGSYRRGAETSGDIDILLTSDDQTEGKKLMTTFVKELLITDNLNKSLVFSSGQTKFMGLGKIENYYRHIDIFYYSQKEYPFALLFSTGPGQFNIEMRADAIKKGYSLSEKELMNKNGTQVTEEEYLSDIEKNYPTDEKDIFDFLGLVYVEPKDRKSGAIINK